MFFTYRQEVYNFNSDILLSVSKFESTWTESKTACQNILWKVKDIALLVFGSTNWSITLAIENRQSNLALFVPGLYAPVPQIP